MGEPLHAEAEGAADAQARVDAAIKAARAGIPVIILDHRELEGDFVIPAQHATPQVINFMLQHGRGVLCAAMMPERAQEIGIRPPAELGSTECPFSDSIDLKEGTTTGVSADDRSKTIRAVAESRIARPDLRVPGHVRTLVARPGLLKERQGHTESSIALCKAAGCYPAAAIIEILNPDGTMMREQDLEKFAKELNLPLVRVDELMAYVS
ncbi:3,4-dihydroxy-2-butanone-4-phosphate synthase [Candidatus Woesearchaeota archaeon CG1_02_57_44]|nr:MAG: 3,4-dihydroxy-2-butanone-4-phosphate synthase [Candidatus Woesearchaeota archaeon CG1_02_57_44]